MAGIGQHHHIAAVGIAEAGVGDLAFVRVGAAFADTVRGDFFTSRFETGAARFTRFTIGPA